MKKIFLIVIAFLCVNILLLMPTIIHYKENPQDVQSQTVQQQVKYFKRVPVKITKVQQTYFFKGMFKMYIEYKSEEYGLTHSVTIGNNEPYANECYMGQYKVGDSIYAVMYTWEQDDTVTRIELGNLDYNR